MYLEFKWMAIDREKRTEEDREKYISSGDKNTQIE